MHRSLWLGSESAMQLIFTAPMYMKLQFLWWIIDVNTITCVALSQGTMLKPMCIHKPQGMITACCSRSQLLQLGSNWAQCGEYSRVSTRIEWTTEWTPGPMNTIVECHCCESKVKLWKYSVLVKQHLKWLQWLHYTKMFIQENPTPSACEAWCYCIFSVSR